jgi:hypothetical protein
MSDRLERQIARWNSECRRPRELAILAALEAEHRQVTDLQAVLAAERRKVVDLQAVREDRLRWRRDTTPGRPFGGGDVA